ncbi:MAG: hypothetical protein LJE97_02605 [Betaproteobacteria bacterium]|nr:hypothetical protein [Betaproteobacteria bacterium]
MLHPATANVPRTASNSGRFTIFCNNIEFLIVIPLTDISKEDCAPVEISSSEIVWTRDDSHRQATPHNAPALCASVHSGFLCTFNELPQTTTGMREKATLGLTASKVSTATVVRGVRMGIGSDTANFASTPALLARGYLWALS